MAFTLPDDGDTSKTAYGHYTLCVYDVKSDDYETMSEALKEIVQYLRSKTKVSLNNNDYIIDWHLSGDMVWHRTERGLDGVNSNHPCYKCRLKKDQFDKINNKQSQNVLRSVDESKIFLELKKNKKEGYQQIAIFDFIPFEKCHIDTLHESIWIPTNILNLLVR